MSISDVPYNLRVKKEIDRKLFSETLRLINKYYDLEKYTYVGMAGPFSEDFKVMYDRFNFNRMFSYEMNPEEYKRQLFNAPLDHIIYKNSLMYDFINDYPTLLGRTGSAVTLGKTVVWLDYTDMDESKLEEFSEAIGKFTVGSVIRITLQTHITNYGSKENGETQESLWNRRLVRAEEKLGRFFYTTHMRPENMTKAGFPKAVFQTLKTVAVSAMAGGTYDFIPLTTYTYQDSVKMLTFTGIILPRGEKTKFLKDTGFQNWKYGLFKNLMPIEIDVNSLSMKEKLELDSKPLSRVSRKLDYFPASAKKSYKFLSKFYPTYAKIV